jgi:hypothetical protein
MGALNRLWHHIFIGWRDLTLAGLVKSQIKSYMFKPVWSIGSIGLIGRSRFRNPKTFKSHNFIIRSLIWINKIWKLIYSMSPTQWCNQNGHINLSSGPVWPNVLQPYQFWSSTQRKPKTTCHLHIIDFLDNLSLSVSCIDESQHDYMNNN